MKPRVMSLVIFTCAVGLFIAPGNIDLYRNFVSLILEKKILLACLICGMILTLMRLCPEHA